MILPSTMTIALPSQASTIVKYCKQLREWKSKKKKEEEASLIIILIVEYFLLNLFHLKVDDCRVFFDCAGE